MIATGLELLRALVFAAAAVAAVAGCAAQLVRKRAINPFGRTARTVRRLTDPLLAPIERRLVRTGMNPQHAAWWLVGITVFSGILLITVAEWLAIEALTVRAAAKHGGRTVAYLVLDWGLGLLSIAMVVRVIGSWMGASRYTWWMRPFAWATEWLLAPIRRVVPAFAMFDLSPLVAWFLIWLVRAALVSRL